MKLKKILTLTIALLAFSFYGYGQVEQEEAPMFGTTRNLVLNPALLHNFGTISGTVQSYQFKIKNIGKTDMNIVDLKLPEKVGITIQNKVIKPGKETVIIATIDPTIADKGKFIKKIVVMTEQREPGIVTKKEITYTITGEVK